jgi:orotidine-5'-phosphate decarboxylase
MLSPRDRLVAALDFPDRTSALAMADRLRGEVGMYKVGKQLFTAEGPDVVRELTGRGDRVFLDLKFHDIPNTVAGAVEAARRLGVSLVNVHALGGRAMMQAAAEAARGTGMRVLAVTVLTSLSGAELAALGFSEMPERLALRLAARALEAGLDGVVAAPTEVAPLRLELGPNFLILTPGIRPAGASRQDQVRVATPEQAVRDGADYLVVGRPITQADDPAAAARAIVGMLQ